MLGHKQVVEYFLSLEELDISLQGVSQGSHLLITTLASLLLLLIHTQLAEPVSVALQQTQKECATLLISKYGGLEKMMADSHSAGNQNLLHLLQELAQQVMCMC